MELSDSDSNAESSEDDSSEDCSDNDTEEEEEKLQLPGDCKRKKRANIEIVDKDGM